MWQENEWGKTQNQWRSQWGTDCSSLPLSFLLLISRDMSFLTLLFVLSLSSLKLAGFYIYPSSYVLPGSIPKFLLCFLTYFHVHIKKYQVNWEISPLLLFFSCSNSLAFLFLAVFSILFSVCETLTFLLLCSPRYNYVLSYSFKFPSCFLSIPKRESSLFKYVSWSQKILT